MGISAGAAAAIAGVASAGAGLAGSAMSAGATSAASKAAQQDQRIAYLMAENNLAPYRNVGGYALDRIGELIGQQGDTGRAAFTQGFQTDPGYQWSVSEGLRGVDAGAASGGLLDSGATRRAEITLAQNLANQQFGTYVNRLYALAGMGQNSATQTATSALNTGANLANTALSQGAAEANIYGNAAKGISSNLNTLFSNKDFQNWIGGSSGSSIYDPTQHASPISPTTSNYMGTGWAGSSGSSIYSPTEIAAAGGWY